MGDVARPYPRPDRDTTPFWEAQNRHELVFQRCKQCEAVRYPVGPLCPRCRSFDFDWVVSGGRGTVHSYTVVHHQAHPAFPVPYTVVLAEMDEGPRVIAQLRTPPDGRCEIGMPVRVEWEDHPHQSLPVFVPDEDRGST
ncbi:MAG: OB-fold domain-containing protein [Chloroflexi bacterium]|nr:OB-fold domain-containing protein [Chloroflexota bacterium]